MNTAETNQEISPDIEILKSARGIIFTDLDGVWFDEENNFAPPKAEVLQTIGMATSQGFVFILNSDTGADALLKFREELGFNGPVIAEKGAVIAWPEKETKDYLFPEIKPLCKLIEAKFIQTIRSQLPQQSLFIGDAYQLIRSQNQYPQTNPVMYLVNSARECSVGIYSRIIDSNGNLTLDDLLNAETQNILENLIPPNNLELLCYSYPNLGSCLVKSKQFSKVLGAQQILKLIPPSIPCWMTGDRPADSMVSIQNRVTSCAVGNADAQLRQDVAQTGGIQTPQELTVSQAAHYIVEQIIGKEEK